MWNKLSLEIGNSASYSIFEKSLLKFIRMIPNSVLMLPIFYEIKLGTRLRLASGIVENVNLDIVFRILSIHSALAVREIRENQEIQKLSRENKGKYQ